MKSILLFISLFCTTALAQNEGYRGGAGTTFNGKVMTFYSAQIVTRPREEELSEIPNLSDLIVHLHGMNSLSRPAMLRYAELLRPSQTRRYYRVDESLFDEKTLDRLREEYVRVFKVPPQEITLFAITDFNSNTTFLLPSFYQLRPSEKMAVLLHEAEWLKNPKHSYAAVTKIERLAQEHFENPRDESAALRFIAAIGTSTEYLKASLAADLRSGALKPLLNKWGVLPLKVLFGEDSIECLSRPSRPRSCLEDIKYNLLGLGIKNPNSRFLPAFSATFKSTDLIERQFPEDMWKKCWNQFFNQAYIRPNFIDSLGGFAVQVPNLTYPVKEQIGTTYYYEEARYRWVPVRCEFPTFRIEIQ